MTDPRRFLSNQSRANSRRVIERRFYLKPTRQTTAILLYLLARALQGRKLALHTFTIQPNHYHVVLTDLSAPHEASDVSAFYQHFNAVSARAINTHLGRLEGLWKDGSYSDRELWGPESLHAQLIYAWIQPVKDGWVDRPEDYAQRAVHFLPKDLGTTLKVSRPDFAFFGGRRSPHRPPTDPAARRRWDQERADEADQERCRWRRRNRKKNKGRSRARRKLLEAQHMKSWLAENQPIHEPGPSRSKLPKEIELQISVPPGFEDRDPEDVRAEFQQLLEAELVKLTQRREEAGLPPADPTRLNELDAFRSAGPSRPNPEGYERIDYRGPKETRNHIRGERYDYLERYRTALSTHLRRKRKRRSPGGKLRKARKTRRPRFPAGTDRMLRLHQVALERDPAGYAPP